nr:MAG: structural protein [Bee densovirus 8]
MELTPIAPPRYRPYDRVRNTLQGAIVAFLAQQGVRIAENQLRTLQNTALDNLLGNLRAAAGQGGVVLSNIFRQLTGRQPENYLEILGMPPARKHKWGEATAAPDTYDFDGLRGRLRNLSKLIDSWTVKYNNAKTAAQKRKILPDLNSRVNEYERWKEYFRERVGTDFEDDDLDRDAQTPQEEPGQIAQQGVRRPAEDQLEAPPNEFRPNTPAEGDFENRPIDPIEPLEAPAREEEGADWLDIADQIANFDIEELFQVSNDQEMGSTSTLAGAAGGGPAMQQPVGPIKKNAPKYSSDGSSVTFSGSRQMYTWGYNYAEQANPFATSLNTAYNAPSAAVVKPLGHTIPWDWIGFYCTPAEWESLNWGTHKIEIEEVGVRVIPKDKSVFFTTGSTQTSAVSTEHAADVFKYVSFPQGAPLIRLQPTSDSTVPINWTATNILAPVQYGRMRDRLWGPHDRIFTGHACLDGIKRELEPILGIMLDDSSSMCTFGSVLHGEHKVVEGITEVLGRGPFIQKKYRPKVGLVHDPSQRVLFTQFASTSSVGTSPYVQYSPQEERLKEAALLLYKNPANCLLNYNQDSGNTLFYTSSDEVCTLYATRKDADPIFTQDTNVYASVSDNTIQTITTEYSSGGTLKDTLNGPVNNGLYYVEGTSTANGRPANDQRASILTHLRQDSAHNSVGYSALKAGAVGISTNGVHNDQVCGGSVVLGNPTNALAPSMVNRPQLYAQAYNSTSTPKSTYTNWTQVATLDKDTDADYGDGANTYTLSSWHAKIEKANSFIPMGADRDCFPDVVPEQEPICFGLNPVIASDPNTGAVDYLKATVNWKIEYYMKIKQTYIPPQLRFVERRAFNTASRTGPTILPYKANYSREIPSRGLEISQSLKGTWTDGVTVKNVAADISDLNPMQRDLTIDGKLLRSIRTADVYHPEDYLSYPNSVQSLITKTPATLGLQKLV